MSDAGHVKTISTANPNDPYGYVVNVLPAGMMFSDISSYEEDARNKWLEDVPKKYWFFTAIFAIIAFALPLYLQYCNRPSQSKHQSQQIIETPISDTVSAHH